MTARCARPVETLGRITLTRRTYAGLTRRLHGRARAHGPLPSDQVARLLRSYRELAEEQAEVKAQLVKLAPAWAELRKVLNELNRVLAD